MDTRIWRLHVNVPDQAESTRAGAVLRTEAGFELRYAGGARCLRDDRDVGEEREATRVRSRTAACLSVTSLSDVDTNRVGSHEADAQLG